MKKCTHLILVLAIQIVFPFSQSWAASNAIQFTDLSQEIQDILNREVDTYKIRRINKSIKDNQTFYYIEARGRENRKLSLTLDEMGKVIHKIYEGQFSVKDGRILREGAPFTIQSVYTPDAGNPQQQPKALIESIGQFSKVGGNVLAFDLLGINPDGNGLTPQADQCFRSIVSRLLYTQISGICRIFHPDCPTDVNYRWQVVRSLAEHFKGDNQFIFWIDGPDAEALGKEFKRIAPNVVVAAPGADLLITDNPNDNPAQQPILSLYSTFPPSVPQGNFLLSNTQENCLAFDRANTLPDENQPWIPDNSCLDESEKAEGFIALFDGITTRGWIPLSQNGKGFVVKDQSLQRVQGGGSIRTVERFGDFILRLDFMIEPNGNSGVQVRCPRANRQSKIGFEVQILGDYGFPPSPTSTGSIYNVIAPTANASNPAGEWNSMEITCQGALVKINLNGRQVQDLNFDDYEELKYRLRDGFIILTDHGNFAAYRNIRIKKL